MTLGDKGTRLPPVCMSCVELWNRATSTPRVATWGYLTHHGFCPGEAIQRAAKPLECIRGRLASLVDDF